MMRKQKSENKWIGAGMMAAVAASLCCITPVLAVLGGLGGIASAFSFLEPLRPYLIGITAVLLGYAFYKSYAPKKTNDIECACEDEESPAKKNFLNSKAFLWIAAALSLLMFTFPYYSQVFFPEVQVTGISEGGHIVSAELVIDGMTCSGCEQSVNYALESEDGVIRAESSYLTGIAHVRYDETKVDPVQLKKVIEENVGYGVIAFHLSGEINQKEGIE